MSGTPESPNLFTLNESSDPMQKDKAFFRNYNRISVHTERRKVGRKKWNLSFMEIIL